MIRIAFLIRRLGHGGAERQLIELAKNLDKARFAIKIFCLYRGGALWDEAKSVRGIEIEDIGKTGRWNLGAMVRLSERLRSWNPQIVHGYMDVANLLALAAKAHGAKVIWGIRGARRDTSHYDFVRRQIYRLEGRFARFCDKIICNSDAALSDVVARGFPADKTCVVPNGIDTTKFSWNPDARRRLRSEWRIEPDQFLVGLVGRLDPIKGHEVFVKAARIVAQRCSEARFILVGDGPQERKDWLQSLISTLELKGKVMWGGARADVEAAICAFDLSVSASLSESFSNTIAESLACGIPCVATDVGDAAKIMCGRKWLACPNDPDDLALKIADAREQRTPGDSEARSLVAYIERNFGTARLARSTEEVLLELVGVNRRI